MVTVDLIFQYFPQLTATQQSQFRLLYELYLDHNQKVNVISRKDMDNFYVHHVLHSLAIEKFCSFEGIKTAIDIGTGGGFPGIPLAIMHPEIDFHLVDSIGKKINVVQSIANEVGLTNVTAVQSRVEQLPLKFDLALARAVAPAKELYGWMKNHWTGKPTFYWLKGGDLTEELNELLQENTKLKIQSHRIAEVFSEDFFETKKVITVG